MSTGYALLDQKFSEKGWPRAGLVELLCTEPGMGELRLLAPALSRLGRETERWIVWIDPPYIPYAPALSALGLDLDRMLLIRPHGLSGKQQRTETQQQARTATRKDVYREVLWSALLALKSGTCSAVLGWFDETRLKAQDVRRLKLAARQGGALAVLFRPVGQQASMADLKIALARSEARDHLHLTVLKQRGGWPAERLSLELPPLSRTSRSSLVEALAQWRASRCIPTKEDTTDLAQARYRTELYPNATVSAAVKSAPVQTLEPIVTGSLRLSKPQPFVRRPVAH